MQKNLPTIIFIAGIFAIGFAINFGLTSQITELGGRGEPDRHYTDWGRVVLTLVFGLGGVSALLISARRK